MPTDLTEYIYLDATRLDAYAAQVNPSGNVIEKAKEWSAGLALTSGPVVAAKQTERVRQMTNHEKTVVILNHLRKNSALVEGRPTENTPGPVFAFEQCNATKVLVPARSENGIEYPSFVFWLSSGTPEPNRSGMLCLLQDFGFDDGPVLSAVSAYSILQSLVHNTRSKLFDSVLWNTFPSNPNPYPYSRIDETHPPSNYYEHHNVAEFKWDFAKDYSNLLSKWGCIVIQPRKIETLYRIREYGRDETARYETTAIFAYPIWISAA